MPLATVDRGNDWRNPAALTIRVFRGTNEFTLYEDDGETMAFENGAYAETKLSVREAGGDLTFTIHKAKGDLSVLPERRDYTLVFDDIKKAQSVTVKVDGRAKQVTTQQQNGKTILSVMHVPAGAKVEVHLAAVTPRENRDKQQLITERLSQYQMTTVAKRLMFGSYIKDIEKPFPSKDEALYGPVKEILQMK